MDGIFTTDMRIFWGIAVCMTAAVAAVLLRSIFASPTVRAGSDLRVYRDQLAEVDRDVHRGTLPPDEAEPLRMEIFRRLLQADKTGAGQPPTRGGTVVGAGLVIIALLTAPALYASIGAPGQPDLPTVPRLLAIEAARADRPVQAEAEAAMPPTQPARDPELADLVDRLRRAVALDPADLRGQRLLARYEAALGDHRAAATAQQRVIGLQGDANAQDHVQLAELLIQAAGGYVSPEAELALRAALRRDPAQPTALYLSGLMMAQGGRDDLAFRDWDLALRVAPVDAPWRQLVLSEMPGIAARAGRRWTPPDPAAEAVRIAERLSRRLGAQGGSAADWARLIAAHAASGHPEQARSAWQKARALFDGDDLGTVRAAATQAGVAE